LSYTTWRQLYVAIIDEILSDLAILVDSDNDTLFDAVYFTRKAAPKDFPCVFLFPDTVREVARTPNKSTYEMSFIIHVVSKYAPSTEGLKDALDRLGYIETYLISDRKFTPGTGASLVDNLEVDRILPEAFKPMVRTRHEAELYVRFIRYWY